MSKKNKIDPEMMSLFKIFGISSILFVILISFFNDKSPNTSNENNLLAIDDASRLYFKNVRQPYYDVEGRTDAKMNIYRLGKRVKSENDPILNIAIIINRIKDEAYLYVEPSAVFDNETIIKIKWISENKEVDGELDFRSGDRYDHYGFVEDLYPLLLSNASFTTEIAGKRHPILSEGRERDAFRITAFDYYRLTARDDMNK
ncbi:hypothetical protein [Anditalea andensis]|uniref:Uncharacterized protein n=1 Tax=Anditalea andensis TaxID=1048983 RepID=A0A074KUE3_9BACT|nr:hypothetical protein [Anditalea andensis]KEO73586.1 hypothetical protein EL17_11845 [Anditalea andensis]